MRTLVSRSFLFGLLLGWAMTHASVFGQDAGKPAEAKPTAVDKIREGLDKKVTINFTGQSLAEVLNQFRDKTGLPINLDPGLAMSPAPPGNQFGGPVGDPITIKGKDEKASDILRRTLNAHQLCYVILGDAIVVTNPDNAIVQQMRQRVSVNVEGVKLREAAKDLAKKHGVNLIINPRTVLATAETNPLRRSTCKSTTPALKRRFACSRRWRNRKRCGWGTSCSSPRRNTRRRFGRRRSINWRTRSIRTCRQRLGRRSSTSDSATLRVD